MGGCGRGCSVSMVARILVIIGAINWGLVGVGMLMSKDWNVVGMLLGSGTVAAIVYILVGVAGVMKIFHCKCKKCMAACTCGEVAGADANKTM